MIEWTQIWIFGGWACVWLLLLIWGGKSRDLFSRTALYGYLMVIVGCVAAGLTQGLFPANSWTMPLTNFYLILSGAVGANYLTHAYLVLNRE